MTTEKSTPSTEAPQDGNGTFLSRPPSGTLRLSPFGGYTVEFERHYDAKVEEVWKTITEPARMVDWWGEAPEMEPAVGGRFVQRFANSGATAYSTILEYEPPRMFAHMWVTGKSGNPAQPMPAKLAASGGTCGDLTLAASVIRYVLTAGQGTRVNVTHYVPLNPELIPDSLSKDVARSAAGRVSKTPAPDMVLATWDIALELLNRALVNPGNHAMSLTSDKKERRGGWPWPDFDERRRQYSRLGRDAILSTFGGAHFIFE